MLTVLNILQVVSILLPLRYDLGYLGGSWAQWQVFSITLIQAAINSKQLPLALALVAELKVSTHMHSYVLKSYSWQLMSSCIKVNISCKRLSASSYTLHAHVRVEWHQVFGFVHLNCKMKWASMLLYATTFALSPLDP